MPRPIAAGSRASPEASDLTDIPLPAARPVDREVGDVDSDFAAGGSSDGGGGGGGGGARALGNKIFAADFCLGFESSSSSSLGQSSLVLRLGFLPLLKEGDENTEGGAGAETDGGAGACA